MNFIAAGSRDPLPNDAAFVKLARAHASDSEWLAAGEELGTATCLLRWFRGRRQARRAVLLVHGASANSRTFLVPGGGLVRYLLEHGLEVWTLDWRASSLLSNRIRDVNVGRDVRQAFDLGHAAKNELKSALEKIEQASSGLPISLLGHCVGGALVAQALIDPELTLSRQLDRVVLTTLGLFFRVGVENWLKGNERVLEEAVLVPSRFWKQWPVISPWAATERRAFAWPPELEKLYEIWKTTPARHACDNPFCHRVSFMFGMPYNANLVEAMHAVDLDAAPESLEAALPEHGFWGQFGDMPVGLYIEVAQSLRQGRLASVGADRDEEKEMEEELRKRFAKVQLTLITGNENQLWHRESIDIMYDWLRRPLDTQPQVTKFVESGFGHQDLFWCEERARRERIYKRFLDSLAREEEITAPGCRLLRPSVSTRSKAVPTR